MIANPQPNYLTPQDYLDWEKHQDIKYEYINGEVFAMTGGTIPHNEIAVNLIAALKNHLRGKGCKVLSSDAKVGISDNGSFHYPDGMVTCDERDKYAIEFVRYPCLIIEVISPSTEAIDQGKNFRHYRRIPTLQEYVLISTDQINVEYFRRNAEGIWELHSYTEENELHLTSVNFHCTLEMLYENVELSS
ncbi:conserved hypothetical protein [Coleofasciculus chthonoplastes PCC 7420]|uniref:Putative restriction endonuclease domain-containing protein n=1 Tax=Coleofasciculus chthonoplastes PCC 7420 TaxID=118168 RepID=B4VP11_9CYAN|nr:Uma2 family endonuclease [Coleofasciculus chthonoplastes]EDX76495.1 conserved hypothetical protein [Coleofasciculus chthonoplastes PCC 7420]